MSEPEAMNSRESDVLAVHLRDRVLTVVLNRPSRLNALNAPLLAALDTVLAHAEDDPAVGAVVIRGAGRAFCVGADLRDGVAPMPVADDDQALARWTEILRAAGEPARRLHDLSKPTIAALRGLVLGAGMGLAAACDFRVASVTTSFSTTFIRVGLPGDCGITHSLVRLVGPARARELMLLSESVDARAAFAMGLVNRVTEDAELESTAQSLAERLAAAPARAVQQIKANLIAGERLSFAEMLDREADYTARAVMGAEYREAVRAFLAAR